ncbi:ribonuclease H-like domain-containing protein [Mycena vitilis]|nr:ribonuclease H-like domain-containing protein [Mycena vitilis]
MGHPPRIDSSDEEDPADVGSQSNSGGEDISAIEDPQRLKEIIRNMQLDKNTRQSSSRQQLTDVTNTRHTHGDKRKRKRSCTAAASKRPRVEPAHAGGDSEEDSGKTSGSDDGESDTTAGDSEETKIKRAGRLFLLNCGLWLKGGAHIFQEALDPAYDEKKRFHTPANKVEGQLRDIKKVLPVGLEEAKKNGWIARMFLSGMNSQRSNTSTRVRKTAGASIFDCSPVDLLTAEARDKKFRDKIGWYVEEEGSAGDYSSLDVAILHLDWKGEYDIDTCFLAPCLMRLYGALIRGATYATDMLELERKIQDGYDGPKIVLNVRGSETMERIFALDHTEPGAIAGSAVLSVIWDAFWTDGSNYKTDKNHHNAWCRACLDVVIAGDREAEILAAAHSTTPQSRKSDAEWYKIAITRPTAHPMAGKPETVMRRHLGSCAVIATSTERQQQCRTILARADAAKNSSASSRSSSQASGSHAHINTTNMLPPFSHSQSFSPFAPSPQLSSGFHSPVPHGPPLSPLMPFDDLNSFSPGPPFSPSPSLASSIQSPLLFDNSSQPNKRRRTSASGYMPVWSNAQQDEFDSDLCKLFVTCGWAWNAAANPEFVQFFRKYIPQATLPDRRVLSGPVLERETEKVVARARLETNGKLATYSEDGWTNIAKTHVDTSLISVETKPYLLKTHDMTGRPKTGEELYAIVMSDLKYALETYGVDVIAVCTDDGPDGKKMRRLIRERCPWIATFECWGHQSHLITGNYLGIKAPWMDAAKRAIEVIKFFNHHQTALDLLRAQEHTALGHYVALLLPVLTRWLSQYCSIRRLLKLKKQIQVVVIAHEETLEFCLGRKQEQIAVARHAIGICNDTQFWNNLERIAKHLEPLAIASNVLQAPYCRLDMVLLTLGNLYRTFRDLPSEDQLVTNALHASLERRWKNTDQELMILAVFFIAAFKRLLRHDADGDVEFMQAFNSYYDNTGFFSETRTKACGYMAIGKLMRRNEHVDLVSIWRRMDNSKMLQGRGGFVSLVVRILSMLPNSAGPERVFSDFGMIHTKRRNRLSPQKVHKASLVRADRLKTHAAAGLIPKRKTRRCSLAEDQAGLAALNTDEDGAGENDDDDSIANDFDLMASVLINLAAQEEPETGDTGSTPARTPSSAPPSATVLITDASTRIPPYTKIPLENLFVYPSVGDAPGDLAFFWRVGHAGVDQEERDMEIVQMRESETEHVKRSSNGVKDNTDRTNIDYDALFDQYLEILTVGLREKSRAILNVFKTWDTTLFPNSERVKKYGSGGNGGNQRALDALRADEKVVSDDDN